MSRLRPGETVDGFRVLERIGAGGGGEVYRAVDPLGRQLALKLLLGQLSQKRLERFAREGEIAATLRHPGIVQVHGMGQCSAGRYLAYALVEGEDLEQAWRRLDRDTLLGIVLAVAEAVGYAHGEGVIHRDLKPSNVLLDAEDRPRVTDFGLALGTGMERLTRTGALVGTPQYMAPEQVAGARARYGPPTDVWALGVMLYRVLTDRLPFSAGSLMELMAQIAASDPERPRALAPEVSLALEAVCMRALQREPSQRHPDALAFAEDLRRARAGGGPSRRSPWAWGAGGVALAVALTLVGAAAIAVRSESPRGEVPEVAEHPQGAPSTTTPTPEAAPDTLGPMLARPEPEALRAACLRLLADGAEPAALRARLVQAGLDPARRGPILEALERLERELPAVPGAPAELQLGTAAYEAAVEAYLEAVGPGAAPDADVDALTARCTAALERIAAAGLHARSPLTAGFSESVHNLARFRAVANTPYWDLLRSLVRVDAPLDALLFLRGIEAEAAPPWGQGGLDPWGRYVQARVDLEGQALEPRQVEWLVRVARGEAEPALGPTQRAQLALAVAGWVRDDDPELAEALRVLALELGPHLPEVELLRSRRAAQEDDWERALDAVWSARARFAEQGRRPKSLSMALDNRIEHHTVVCLIELGRRDEAREVYRRLTLKGQIEAGQLRERYPWLER